MIGMNLCRHGIQGNKTLVSSGGEIKKIMMIMINEDWEQVKNLSDVLRIVSENIGGEFAQKVKEIIEENYEYTGDE